MLGKLSSVEIQARLDRDRAFYSTVAIVVASYYSLFAAMGGGTRALVIESLVGLAFLVVAVLGFRFSMWFVVSALAGHGIFDLVHGAVISNPGVPALVAPVLSDVRCRRGGVSGVADRRSTYTAGSVAKPVV